MEGTPWVMKTKRAIAFSGRVPGRVPRSAFVGPWCGFLFGVFGCGGSALLRY